MTEKSFLERIKDEVIVPVFDTNEACQDCLFARGKASWYFDGKREIRPDLCNCLVYEPDDVGDKPVDVARDGADCEFYEKAV